jgi:hypothetical protein
MPRPISPCDIEIGPWRVALRSLKPLKAPPKLPGLTSLFPQASTNVPSGVNF